ncbi:ABC transporter ATP-binding protein [Franzmannia qiaohouensis]|uniref:ABC transporter ATP-binding protein n=1 Tax=Franzmannia qiaohouensis TaxID=1329370 RepID=A0ABU1HBB1_9GAMM|nr:ABC transporter ATP-binding protein [Halomonas qiaohouensis]MDR5904159.1 ABC transporter ATP-binding protein [Halomonas qiaohouensis]
MTAILTLDGLTKRYGQVTAVDNVSLSIDANEFFSLIGPSGCGKTTTLRSVAGLESAQQGAIQMAGRTVFDAATRRDLPPNKRPIGMVFQSYAVWPHMNIYENIGYPLKVRGLPRDAIKARVQRVLDMLGMGELGARMPSQLSGGQQQRVALGRALAIEPSLLLLDEPLSNLDAKLRESMRAELKQVQRDTGLPILYVTHDQDEALAMSDRIGVMSAGVLHQIGTPTEVYTRPATRFVLDFIGTVSYLPCDVLNREGDTVAIRWGDAGEATATLEVNLDTPERGPASLAVRPEHVQLTASHDAAQPGLARGTIKIRAYLGDAWEYHVRVGDCLVRVRTDSAQELEEGSEVAVGVRQGFVVSAADSERDSVLFD